MRGEVCVCGGGSKDGNKDGEEGQEKGTDEGKEKESEAGQDHHEGGKTKGGKKRKYAEESFAPSKLTCEGHHQEIDAADEVNHDDHIKGSNLRRRKNQARVQRMQEAAECRM